MTAVLTALFLWNHYFGCSVILAQCGVFGKNVREMFAGSLFKRSDHFQLTILFVLCDVIS